MALVSTSNSSQQLHNRLQQSTSSPKFLNLDKRTISLTDALRIDSDSSPEEFSRNIEDFSDDEDDLTMEINVTKDNKPLNGNLNERLINKQILNFNSNECIPEYSASQENKNVRNFHMITLPDGKTREIDMKVSFNKINLND